MPERKRSWEFSAIPITIVLLGALGILMWAFTAGLWAWVAVGVVALVALVAVALFLMSRPRHPSVPEHPSLPEGAAPHLEDGLHRVLVIADEDCAPVDLGAAIAEYETTRTEAFVIAPALGTRTARWTSDDHAYEEAGKHLEATLSALTELNVRARGHVGSHDPLQAADDGLREFPADEIVFAVHPAGAANWLEDGVVESAKARYSIPVRDLVVSRS